MKPIKIFDKSKTFEEQAKRISKVTRKKRSFENKS